MENNNHSPENTEALKELLYKMADDQLILGHRNSEWTGIGPIIEEDIAFGSLAQDKVGQAYNLYQLLHDLGENEPDQIAFNRKVEEFKCCHFVEYPIGEYDFSLIRHFLFDHAELLRFEMLAGSSYQPLANLAKKFKGEIKYHVFHANTFISQLAKGTEESRKRMQIALDYAFPLALGIFEPSPFEEILKKENIFAGEETLKGKWLNVVKGILENADLKVPEVKDPSCGFGGRQGKHTEYLAPMLKEMTEVFSMDASAAW